MNRFGFIAVASVFIMTILALGCSSVRTVKNELTENTKPEGEIEKTVPTNKAYPVSHQKLWAAALKVMDEQGYLYEANKSSNMIITELQSITDLNKVQFVGTSYMVKLYITVEGSSITYKARYNKKSNIVQFSENREYPEKENAMRKEFFDALNEKLGFISLPMKKDTTTSRKVTNSESGTDMISIKGRYSAVNIRKSNSTSSPVLAQLRKNDKVTVLAEQGDWIKIQLEDGREGWIYKYLMIGFPDK